MLCLGIDQHRKQLTVCVRNEAGDVTLRRQVSTEWRRVRVQLPSQEDADARQVTELRKRLGQLRTRTINRIKHLLRKHNLEQEYPTKGLDTIRGRKWLAKLELGPTDRLEMDLLLKQWSLWDEQIK